MGLDHGKSARGRGLSVLFGACLRARSSNIKNPTDKLVLRPVFFDPLFCHATLNRHRRFGNLATKSAQIKGN